MPDSKITALTSIGNTTDPAADPLVVVDVSDTSMAGTGTTKKVTVNGLLSTSPTASGNFTITGDLTVDTSTLKVDSANNRVGIGTASPAYLAHIRSTSPILSIQDDTSAAGGVGGTLNFIAFTSGTSGANIEAQIKGVKSSASSAGELQFFTSDSSGNSVQRFMVDGSGNLGLGVTPSAGGGVLQLKSGITFPATQVASSDANTLDDYEEGTFTATLKGSTGDPTTAVTATGKYTKIGRQVIVQVYFSGNTTGASGRIFISGLPFAASSAPPDGTVGSILMDSIGTFTGSPAGWIGASGTTVELYQSVSNGATAAVVHNPGTSRSLWVSITYTV